MNIPARITIHHCAYALDGGTTYLRATDEAGQQRVILLVQHAFPAQSGNLIPGRLYFDGALIPMRSADELAVLSLLKAAEVKYTSETRRKERVELSPNALILSDEIRSVLTRGPEENIRLLVAQFVQFVESDEYFRFAERVDQATDTTKYTVWIASDSTNQKQAAVRLGRVRGDGWKSAQDFLGSNRPLAEGLSALQVIEMADRYAAEGLTLRVEPAFRWRLAGNAEH